MPTISSLEIRKGTSTAPDPAQAAKELFDAIHQPDIELALFYCSPAYEREALGAELRELFGGVPLIGCTTAGEITPSGYLRGAITGISFAGSEIVAKPIRIGELSSLSAAEVEDITRGALAQLPAGSTATAENTFAFLLIDGLCMKEELVVAGTHRGLGEIPLFGGSAGDGISFDSTHVYCDGAFHNDSATLVLFQTERPFTVFRTQHFEPTDKTMVATSADPIRRVVREINGATAADEYARVLGLETEDLSPMTFATHPVVVDVDGELYVRSIQQVNDDGELTFFCAVEEGTVLTVAQGVDMVEDLNRTFANVREKVGDPEVILGCDCILRHLETDRVGNKQAIAKAFADNNVIGFSTYGEQFDGVHVNQTFTGVAIGSKRPTDD